MRMPTKSIGQYTGSIKDTRKIVGRCTSYAAHAGAKIQTEQYTAVNIRTGSTMAVIQVTVLSRGNVLQKRGRKPGAAWASAPRTPIGNN